MVNTGRPSQACERCRRLKTKCCETRPACTRCTRREIPCFYRSEVTFRSMNDWSEKTVQTRVAKKLTDEMLRAPDAASCQRQISLNWAGASIGPFFDRYVALPDHPSFTWGFLPDLPQKYAAAGSTGHLALAVQACALSNMANASKMDYSAVAAYRMYGSALRTLCAAMDEPEAAAREGALTTMMLLAMYEGISGTKMDEELFHAHHRGQASVLRLGASDPTLSEMNASVFSHTNRRILLRDMAERRSVTYGLTDSPSSTCRSWLNQVTVRFQVRIIEACARVNELQHRTRRNELWVSEFLAVSEEMSDIDSCILTCIQSCPPEWRRRTLSADWGSFPAIDENFPSYSLSNLYSNVASAGWKDTKVPPILPSPTYNDQRPYRPRLDVYQSRAIGHLWNFLFCSSLHLFRAMIDVAYLLHEIAAEALFPSSDTIRARISDTIHDILASVPFLLGDLDVDQTGHIRDRSKDPSTRHSGHGLNLLFPLHKVCALPGVNSSVRGYVLDTLARIGTSGHVRQAINLRDLYVRIYAERRPSTRTASLWDEVRS